MPRSAGVPPGPSLEKWLEEARRGSEEALGRALEACRPYLLQVAREELAPQLRAKLGASDLVQETFLEAQRDFRRFRGCSEADWLAWMRRILLNNVANQTRHFRHTKKRRLGREVALSDAPLDELIEPRTDQGGSPSRQARQRERDAALAAALARLPEPQQQVIRLRNYERLTFEEVGRRMGRSAEAVRKLWGRAIESLQQLLEHFDEPE